MTEIPTWHKEAIERKIDYIVLVYEKAEGFVFCPSNLANPFRVGGDYDGSMEADAAGAIHYFASYMNQAFVDKVSWFMDFARKVAANEDFSIDDLDLGKRQVRIISGKWPW